MKRAGLVLAIVLLSAPSAWAARTKAHEAAESPEYGRKAGGMIGRGVINGTTFIIDPLVNIVNETRNGPPLVGTLVGLGKGLGCGVLRAGSAVVDLTTFWVPGFNGFPVSDSYDNCLDVTGVSTGGSPSMSTESMPAGSPSEPTWTEPASGAAAPAPEKPKYTK